MAPGSMRRVVALLLVLAVMCVPAFGRSRFAPLSNEEMLRRSLDALGSARYDGQTKIAKERGLRELAQLRHPPGNAEALAVQELRGPAGDMLAPVAGRLLLRLGLGKRQVIEKLAASGEIPQSRAAAALKPFEDVTVARAGWEKGNPAGQSRAFHLLLGYSAATHDDFITAMAHQDVSVRGAAPLVAAFLDLSNDDWQKIAALLHDPSPIVRKGAMEALTEDSVPDPSAFDNAVLAMRHDAVCQGIVLSWFTQSRLDRNHLDQLGNDLRSLPSRDRIADLQILAEARATPPEEVLQVVAIAVADRRNGSEVAGQANDALERVLRRLAEVCRNKPEREQQAFAAIAPLLRNPEVAGQSHALLLNALLKLNHTDTSDLADIFIADLIAADGMQLSSPAVCLTRAWEANRMSVGKALWQTLHDPDPNRVRIIRTFIADHRFDEMQLVALRNGSASEKLEVLETLQNGARYINADQWSAVAECTHDADPTVRGMSLRTLIKAASEGRSGDEARHVFVGDAVLAAMDDADAGMQELGLSHAGSVFLRQRPGVLGIVVKHLDHPREAMRAAAWYALKEGIQNGAFRDLQKMHPAIGDSLNDAVLHGPPSIKESATEVWLKVYPGTRPPQPPLPPVAKAILLMLIGVCVVPLGLLIWAFRRNTGVSSEPSGLTDAQKRAASATKALGLFIVGVTLLAGLLTLFGPGNQKVISFAGLLLGLGLLASLLMGLAIAQCGKLVQSGRLLDQVVALIPIILVILPMPLVVLAGVAAIPTARDSLQILIVLSQLVTVGAVLGLGITAIWQIALALRAPRLPVATVQHTTSGAAPKT